MLPLLLLATSCSSTDSDPDEPEIEVIGVDIASENATLAEGENREFSVMALTASGEEVPLSDLGPRWDWLWVSMDHDVITVTHSGNATAQGTGDTFCWVFLADLESENPSEIKGRISRAQADSALPEMKAIFVGRDSVFVSIGG